VSDHKRKQPSFSPEFDVPGRTRGDATQLVLKVLAALQVTHVVRSSNSARLAGSVVRNTWNRRARREAKRAEGTLEQDNAATALELEPFEPPEPLPDSLFGFDILISGGEGHAKVSLAWIPPSTSEDINQSKVYFQQFVHELETRVRVLAEENFFSK